MTKTAPPTSKITLRSYELINGQELRTVIDYLDEIIPREQQVYSLNGDREIDQKKVLLDMLKNLRRGEVGVNYLYSKNANSHGRQYASGGRSVQSLSRAIRHTLCGKTYRDFDIKNCHPTIALHVCKMNGWDVPELERYVSDRAECIQEIIACNPTMMMEYIKTIYISILNGGSQAYKSVEKKTHNLTALYYEIRDVFGKMLELPQTQSLLQEIGDVENKKPKDKRKTVVEIRRSACNKIFIDIENNILNCCVEWLQSLNIDTRNIVLMFDGFMLPIHEATKIPDGWEELLTDYVELHSSSHIRVQFTEKPMTEGKDISQFTIKREYIEQAYANDIEEADLVHYAYNRSDLNLANLIYRLLGNRYVATEDKLYFFKGHRWYDYGDNVILNEVMELNVIYDDVIEKAKLDTDKYSKDDEANKEVGELYENLKKARLTLQSTAFVRKAIEVYKQKVLNVNMESILDSRSGLVGFNNGVLDFTGDEVVFRDGKPNDYISLTTRIDYHPVETTVDAEAFLRDIVDGPTYLPLVQFLSSLFVGGNPTHKTTFIVGSGSNGKSLLCEIMEALLGDYVSNVSKEVYTKEKKNAGSPEPHLMALKGRLMGLTNETEEDDKFLSAVFKSMSSTDTLTTRGMFSKRMTTFKPLYKPVISTNHLPQFTSFDDGVSRRIRIIRFPYQFVQKHLVVNETNENGEEVIVKKEIDEYKGEFLKKHEVLMQFLELFRRHHKQKIVDSGSMVDEVKTYFDTLNPICRWFNQNYDKVDWTEDDNVKISVFDLRNAFNTDMMAQNKKTLSETSFGKFIRKVVEVKRTMEGMVIVGYTKKFIDIDE